MPDFIQMIATLREQMHAELTRTDALRPLVWPIAGLLLALSGSVGFGAPSWAIVVEVVLIALLVTAYLGAYCYFAINDPDALRSEKYKLQKLAIEHGLFGDSLSGLREISSAEPAKTIDVTPALGKPND